VVKFVSRARPALSVPSSVVYELDQETYTRIQGVINELSDEDDASTENGMSLLRSEALSAILT